MVHLWLGSGFGSGFGFGFGLGLGFGLRWGENQEEMPTKVQPGMKEGWLAFVSWRGTQYGQPWKLGTFLAGR